MQPVIGVDVAKGFSVIQAFIGRNDPYGRAENLQHGEESFEWLGELLGELKRVSSGWTHYIVNPLQAKRSKGTQLRKVKTDAADAWHLAECITEGTLKRTVSGKKPTPSFNT